MALVNSNTRQIHCKVLYVGPSLSGKTTSLKSLYKELTGSLASPESLFFDKDETTSQYFEFLPLGLGRVNSYDVRLHVYSRPLWGVYEALEGLLFHNLDGLIYVMDSDFLSMEDNLDELTEVQERLDDKGYNLSSFPQVFQYNKRDVKNSLPLHLLENELNSYRFPSFESVATQSVGVKEAFLGLSQQILKKLSSEAVN